MAETEAEPTASRPRMPGYGVPRDRKDLLPWSHAVERLEQAQQYWVVTAGSDATPHAVPVWGAWVDGVLYFVGGSVRWTRNLRDNPRVVVHLESGADVVILEGTAEWVTEADGDLVQGIENAGNEKYGKGSGLGLPSWALRPTVAFGWTLERFPKDATRWRFEER